MCSDISELQTTFYVSSTLVFTRTIDQRVSFLRTKPPQSSDTLQRSQGLTKNTQSPIIFATPPTNKKKKENKSLGGKSGGASFTTPNASLVKETQYLATDKGL
ncbi:hypothetical protein JTE90_021070 [Oedothorax gibbosus]|uniref:Uncharacterized protein n=1 Tax=Oedothorax gibbosus TaxID=931172 RepID=A0AAV6VSJ0_9ARAC|nr:hypothetical protein JTE90_021070 [Oedothorax gibbosus]